MKNNDFRNLIIGFLFGLSIMLIIGAASFEKGIGRYEGCAGSDDSYFLIDTRTGQTWHMERTAITDFGTPTERKSKRTAIASHKG